MAMLKNQKVHNMYAYIIYIYVVILKEAECENVTRCSIKWEEAVVKCIVYLLKDGKKHMYMCTVYTIYV